MTEKRRNIKAAWVDPDDAPELTDDFFDRAEIAIGDVVIRPANGTLTKPGRPKSAAPKKSVHLRLSPDVLTYFRKTGPGWQTRIDETLRKAAKLKPRKK
ncbi:MAG: BrnA antitoxin family protein [Alphaproteobacteria bacterium]|nr:BrnA antitoxin family protein [Alphaproteobacteria bacterium]MBV9693007.1 BrnA antitoxin family protein [Alphaproteobacteria bacterium]